MGELSASTRRLAHLNLDPPSEGSSKLPPQPDLGHDSESETQSEEESDVDVVVTALTKENGDEVFALVNDIDPSVCPPCINIVCAFADHVSPIRTPGKPSEAYLLHHDNLQGLFECSTTCHICSFFCHLIDFGQSETAQMIAKPSQSEEELCRLASRDEKILHTLLEKHEKLIWKKNPFNVIHESARAYLRKQGGLPGLINYDIGGLEHLITPGREELLVKWAWELWTSHNTLQELDPRSLRGKDPLVQVALEHHSSDNLVQDPPEELDAISDLIVVADALQQRRKYLSERYELREVYGYKGQPVEFQLRIGAHKDSCRVYTQRGLSIKHLGRQIQHNANSNDTFTLIKSWINECVDHHPECMWSVSASKEDPLLPSRVIDVGVSESSVPKLFVTAAQRAKWVALSHRWGHQEFLTTIRSNLEEMTTGINLSALPATFQDAMTITRNLGIRYLWIDSLCIIQDSSEDWLIEAAKMPNIYRNAYVTIAAAATETSSSGIFVDRAWTPTSKPCKLPIPLIKQDDLFGTPTCIPDPFTGTHGTIYFDIPFEAKVSEEETNYLRTRAWCFQESQLSHRLLTFDRLQLSYTCVRYGLIESRELPLNLAREGRNTFLSQFQGIQGPFAAGDAKSRRLIISWYNLLWDYTRRELTFSNDILVAISGIANVVGTCIQDEYYAGLWRNDMPCALLWSPYEEELLPNQPRNARLPPIYRAPSWSWASIDGQISCFLCREKPPETPIATIIGVNTTLVGSDKYGQVSAGYLKIRAPLKHAVCGEHLDVWPQQPRLHLDGCGDNDISHCIFDIEQLPIGRDVWCLQITAIYGLILVKKEGEEGASVYSRVGIFHLRTREKLGFKWFTSDNESIITII